MIRDPRVSSLAAFVVALVALGGCSSEEKCAPRVVTTEQSCTTTQDCVDAGYKNLACVNRVCGRACTRDDECALPKAEDETACTAEPETEPTFICEAELCKAGCPDVPCASGETCVAGRCTLYFESFELRPGQDVVTPKSLGWNALEGAPGQTKLENRETVIVYSGAQGCSLGDERCAGIAADGVRFVSLERVPTPARSTPASDTTCRACACCLACQLNPPADGDLATIPACPGSIDEPEAPMCTGAVPAVCDGVCTACDACPDAPAREVGTGLLTCEADVAPKGCSACIAYDRCATEQLETRSCTDPTEPCSREDDCGACIVAACEDLRAPCFLCRDAAQCELESPGSAECRTLSEACDAQGADGCFTTPIDRPRSQLTDDEQALVSPEIEAIAGATGRVVLELEYVPFDIREKYRRVIQGQPSSTWPIEDQEVVVELCPGNCQMASSWVEGKLVSDARAIFPPQSQRRNGLSFGNQSLIDWRSNRLVVEIPELLRTADFRFRLLPRLDADARVGLDAVQIRRR